MELGFRVHRVVGLPSLQSGDVPRFCMSLHCAGQTALALPAKAGLTLAPIKREEALEADSPSGEAPARPRPVSSLDEAEPQIPCLSLEEGAGAAVSVPWEAFLDQVFNAMTRKDQQRLGKGSDFSHLHPATRDTIVSRMLNTRAAVNLIAFVPQSLTPFAQAGGKKQDSKQKQAPQPEADYVAIPLASAQVDLFDLLSAALEGAPRPFLYSLELPVSTQVLGEFGAAFQLDASSPPVETLVELSVSLPAQLVEYARGASIGQFSLESLDVGGAMEVPGHTWTVELCLPVEARRGASGAPAVKAGVFLPLCGGIPAFLPQGKSRPSSAANAHASHASGGQTRKSVEISPPAPPETPGTALSATLSMIFPGSAVGQLPGQGSEYSLGGTSRSAVSGAQGFTRTGGFSQTGGFTPAFGPSLDPRLELPARSLVESVPDHDSRGGKTRMLFPEYTHAFRCGSLQELNSYVCQSLDQMKEQLEAIIPPPAEEPAAAKPGKGGPSGSASGTRAEKARTQEADASSKAAQPGGKERARFPSELFEPFYLTTHKLLRSRALIVFLSVVTRDQMQSCREAFAKAAREGVRCGAGEQPGTRCEERAEEHSDEAAADGSASGAADLLDSLEDPLEPCEYPVTLTLFPAPNLLRMVATAMKAAQSVAKPPLSPYQPLITTHALYPTPITAQQASLFFAETSRAGLYLTGAPDQPFNKIAPPLPTGAITLSQEEVLGCHRSVLRLEGVSLLGPSARFSRLCAGFPLMPYDPLLQKGWYCGLVSLLHADLAATADSINSGALGGGAAIADDDFSDEGSEESPDASGAGPSPVIRGKAAREADQKAAKRDQKDDSPAITSLLQVAGRYSDGSVNFTALNFICGACAAISTLAGLSRRKTHLLLPSASSPRLAALSAFYAARPSDAAVARTFLLALRRMERVYCLMGVPLPPDGASLSLRSPVPSFEVDLVFHVPIALKAPALGEAGGGRGPWPAELRARRGLLEEIQDICQGEEAAPTRGGPAGEGQAAKLGGEVSALLSSATALLAARYRIACKPVAEISNTSKVLMASGAAPLAGGPGGPGATLSSAERRSQAVLKATRQLGLRGLGGQIISQAALATPKVLPKISQLLKDETPDLNALCSPEDLRRMASAEGLGELLERRLLRILTRAAMTEGLPPTDLLCASLSSVDGYLSGAEAAARASGADATSAMSGTGSLGLPSASAPAPVPSKEFPAPQFAQPPGAGRVPLVQRVLLSDTPSDAGALTPATGPGEDPWAVAGSSGGQGLPDTVATPAPINSMAPAAIGLVSRELHAVVQKACALLCTGVPAHYAQAFTLASAALQKAARLCVGGAGPWGRGEAALTPANVVRLQKILPVSDFRSLFTVLLVSGAHRGLPPAVESLDDVERLQRFVHVPVGLVRTLAAGGIGMAREAVSVDAGILALIRGCQERGERMAAGQDQAGDEAARAAPPPVSAAQPLIAGGQDSSSPEYETQYLGLQQQLAAARDLATHPQGPQDCSEPLLRHIFSQHPSFLGYVMYRTALTHVDPEVVLRVSDSKDASIARMGRKAYCREDLEQLFLELGLPPLSDPFTGASVSLHQPADEPRRDEGDKPMTTGSRSNGRSAGGEDGAGLVGLAGSVGPAAASADQAGQSAQAAQALNAAGSKDDRLAPFGQHAQPAQSLHTAQVIPEIRLAEAPVWVLGGLLFLLHSDGTLDPQVTSRALLAATEERLKSAYSFFLAANEDSIRLSMSPSVTRSAQQPGDERVGRLSEGKAAGSFRSSFSVTASPVPGPRIGAGGAPPLPHSSTMPSGSSTVVSLEGRRLNSVPPGYLSQLQGQRTHQKGPHFAHQAAVREYLYVSRPGVEFFAQGVGNFAGEREFCQWFFELSLPNNTQFGDLLDDAAPPAGQAAQAGPDDSRTAASPVQRRRFLHLACLASLAEWLLERGETRLSARAIGLGGTILYSLRSGDGATLGGPQVDAGVLLQQELRLAVCEARRFYVLGQHAQLVDYTDRILGDHSNPYLANKAKACPAFLLLRARSLAALSTSFSRDFAKLDPSVDYTSLNLGSINKGALQMEAARLAMQACQLASRSKAAPDDFLRGSSSLCESASKSPGLLYTSSLLMVGSVPLSAVAQRGGLVGAIMARQRDETHGSQDAIPGAGAGPARKPVIDMDLGPSATPQGHGLASSESSSMASSTFSMVQIPVGETAGQGKLNGRLRSKLGEMKITCVSDPNSQESSFDHRSLDEGASGPPGAGVMGLEQFRLRKQEAAAVLGEEKLATPSSPSPRSQIVSSDPSIGGEVIGLAPSSQKPTPSARAAGATPGSGGSSGDESRPYRDMATALASVSMLATSRAGGYSVGRLEKDQLRFFSAAAGAVRSLLRIWPFFAPAWAECAVVQLGLGNYAEARVSSSLATLFGPESCEPWMSWVLCELQEISGDWPGRASLMGSISTRRAQVLGYLRQIEAIGTPSHLEEAWGEAAAYARGVCE